MNLCSSPSPSLGGNQSRGSGGARTLLEVFEGASCVISILGSLQGIFLPSRKEHLQGYTSSQRPFKYFPFVVSFVPAFENVVIFENKNQFSQKGCEGLLHCLGAFSSSHIIKSEMM